MLTDFFVQFLAVAACFYSGHNDIFGGHERQFGFDAGCDNARIDDQAVQDVDEDFKDSVDGEKGLGDDDSSVGRVIEGSFEPLLGGGGLRAAGETENKSAKRGYPFAAHRISFVGHRG